MKTILAGAVTAGLALLLHSPMAQAEGVKPSSTSTIAQTRDPRSLTDPMRPHYEWQYHYVGSHGRMEGYWALVR
jgi:hypothetical protein